MEFNTENNNENCLEFLSGERYVTVSFSNRKHINRVKKIYEERGSEFKYLHENTDGSICAKMPLKWLKLNPGSVPGTRAKREMTEEQKQALRERLAAGRAKSAGKKK